MAYVVIARVVVADIVMACIAMAYIVMADIIVMTYIVMAYTVMAYKATAYGCGDDIGFDIGQPYIRDRRGLFFFLSSRAVPFVLSSGRIFFIFGRFGGSPL